MACPICERSADLKYRPFCSKRCADLDLARWLGDGYAIPGEELDPEDIETATDDGEGAKSTRPQ